MVRHLSSGPNVLPPSEELGDAVDLIVMAPVWKGEQLVEEVVEPRGVLTQMNLAGLDFRRLGGHAVNLASLGRETDRARQARNRFMPGPAFSIRIVAGRRVSARLRTIRRRSGYWSRPRKTSRR